MPLDKCTDPAIRPTEGCRVGRVVVLSICEGQRRLIPEKGYEDGKEQEKTKEIEKHPGQILEGLQDVEFFGRFLVVFVRKDTP